MSEKNNSSTRHKKTPGFCLQNANIYLRMAALNRRAGCAKKNGVLLGKKQFCANHPPPKLR
jgi:hypothetical protein